MLIDPPTMQKREKKETKLYKEKIPQIFENVCKFLSCHLTVDMTGWKKLFADSFQSTFLSNIVWLFLVLCDLSLIWKISLNVAW